MIRAISIVMVILLLAGCTGDPLPPDVQRPTNGWREFHPGPIGYNLNEVYASSPTNVWAVGSYGTIVHWNGERVLRVDSPSAESYVCLDGWAPDRLVAAGREHLARYDGHTWQSDPVVPGGYMRGLLCASDGSLYVTSSHGLSLREADGWHRIEGPSGNADVIWEDAEHRILVGDGSRLWQVAEGAAEEVWQFSEAQVVSGHGDYVAAVDMYNGGVYKREGEVWNYQHHATDDIVGVLDWDGLLIYADNSGLHFNDDGYWGNRTGRWMRDAMVIDENHFVYCGTSGTLIMGRVEEGLCEFTEAEAVMGYDNFNALAGVDCGDLWCAEWWGRVLHYHDSTWTREFAYLPSSERVSHIKTLPEGTVFAASNQRVSRRLNEVWYYPFSVPEGIRDLEPLDADHLLVGTSAAAYLASAEDGAWSLASVLDEPVIDFTISSGGEVFCLAGYPPNQVWRWTGTTFTLLVEIPGFDGVSLVADSDGETIYTTGISNVHEGHSVVYRIRDGQAELISVPGALPLSVMEVGLLEDDELVLLTYLQVWIWRDGLWLREAGLPGDEYFTAMWICEGKGVYVEGAPLFYKDFSEE